MVAEEVAKSEDGDRVSQAGGSCRIVGRQEDGRTLLGVGNDLPFALPGGGQTPGIPSPTSWVSVKTMSPAKNRSTSGVLSNTLWWP